METVGLNDHFFRSVPLNALFFDTFDRCRELGCETPDLALSRLPYSLPDFFF
jgi:hypothetical protein